MHVAEVRVYEDAWEAFEWTMRRLIVEVRNVDGLLASWMARSQADAEVAQLVTLWEDRDRMEAYWRGDYYRQRVLPQFVRYIAGEVPTSTSEVVIIYSRLPTGRRSQPRHRQP